MSAFRPSEPDFSRPLEMLRACHDRIRAQCRTLRELVAHLRDHGCDEHARQAAGDVVRYLDGAIHDHHEDEEQDLLPRMMAAATLGRGSSLTRLVADITNEHRAMSRAWTELRAALHGVAAGENAVLNAVAVDYFTKLYQSHITVEEANVLPLAEMILSKDDLTAIGASMAERRGVPFP